MKITKKRFWELFQVCLGVVLVVDLIILGVYSVKTTYEEYQQEYSVAEETLTLEVESFAISDGWFKVNTADNHYYTRSFTYSTEVSGMYVVLTKKEEKNIAQFIFSGFTPYADDIYSVVVIIGNESVQP